MSVLAIGGELLLIAARQINDKQIIVAHKSNFLSIGRKSGANLRPAIRQPL